MGLSAYLSQTCLYVCSFVYILGIIERIKQRMSSPHYQAQPYKLQLYYKIRFKIKLYNQWIIFRLVNSSTNFDDLGSASDPLFFSVWIRNRKKIKRIRNTDFTLNWRCWRRCPDPAPRPSTPSQTGLNVALSSYIGVFKVHCSVSVPSSF